MDNFWDNLWDGVTDFLSAVFSGSTGEKIEKVINFGKPIVLALVDEDLPNNVKRDTAINQIGVGLKSAGEEVADHIISLGVELLVAQLKG